MAGDWLKIERSLSDKPEVWAIAATLEIDPDAVVGKLIRIWSWFDEQTEAGTAPSVSQDLLDRRAGVRGFCAAMIAAGWMCDDGVTLRLPHFDRHNSQTAKNRALTAKRVAAHQHKTKANAAGVKPALARKENNEKSPHSPPTRGKRSAMGIDSFLTACKAAGEKPIPADDPIFAYAQASGIPAAFLGLCFREFVERNAASGKRYKDWRAAFRNCVRGRWYRLWWIDAEGACQLTADGRQAANKHRRAPGDDQPEQRHVPD